MMNKLESFIFVDLIATVIIAVLAYGTVEPWSLALFVKCLAAGTAAGDSFC
jgi:hypothetical protein